MMDAMITAAGGRNVRTEASWQVLPLERLIETPPALIDKLNAQIVRGLKSPDVQSKLAADGSETVGSTPAEFGAHIKSEIAKWAKITKEAGIKAE